VECEKNLFPFSSAAMVEGHITAPTALLLRLEVGVDDSVDDYLILKFRAATFHRGVAWQTSEARPRAHDAYAGFLLR
jgi:hypothetical protein